MRVSARRARGTKITKDHIQACHDRLEMDYFRELSTGGNLCSTDNRFQSSIHFRLEAQNTSYRSMHFFPPFHWPGAHHVT